MKTFDDVGAVVLDRERRKHRVLIFFHTLFALAIVALLVVDLMPPRPHMECHVAHAQMQSHYPHPYGPPPPGEWTVCEMCGTSATR